MVTFPYEQNILVRGIKQQTGKKQKKKGGGSYPYTVCAEVLSRHRAHHTDLIVPTCLVPSTGQILIARWTNYARSRSYKITMFTSTASVCTSVS